MKYLLIGYGLANRDIEKYLIKHHLEYNIFDIRKIEHQKYLSINEIIDKEMFFDIGIKSPGVRYDDTLRLLNIVCIKIISYIEFALDKIKYKKLICLSGSNGKTTCLRYLYAFLKLSHNVCIGGNINESIIDKGEVDIVILELSSYILEDISSLKIDTYILTSYALNHLDFYPNQEYYYLTKMKGKYLAKEFIDLRNYQYQNIFNLKLSSINKKYAEFAYQFAKELSVNIDLLNQEILKLEQLPFRLNQVYKNENLIFINDSKSTSSSSCEYAYNEYKNNPVILIIGGIHKSDSFSKIKVKNNDKVLIYGRDKERIRKEINGEIFNNLEEIFKYLKALKGKWYVVFSPGCASFDQFANYEERAKYFNELIHKFFIDV